MLEELHVKDLALIEEAWLELGPGMTVLTGETGAGKTVLVGALKLLLGDRADATLVRSGSNEAVVEGRFVVGDVERTARRRVAADGRSRCYLDGEMATVGGLASALGPLVDLHGQHDHQELLRQTSHAVLLDRFADAGPLMEDYRLAFAEHAARSGELERALASMGDRERRLERLRAVVDDIDRLGPEPGEDAALQALLPRLRHAERLIAASSGAYRALTDDGAALDRLGETLSALRQVAGIDPDLDAATDDASDIEVRMRGLAARVRDLGEGIEHDPASLEAAESRLAALEVLKRSYGPALDDVLAARDAAESEASLLESGEAGLEGLRERLSEADAAVAAAAERLIEARDGAAAAFESRLADAARELSMPSARFQVRRERLPREAWSSAGPERVEFLYAPVAGESARPLVRTASGGEVSRVMLALKSVLGQADTVPVLVFDEIDAGVGGATAIAVGRRLKRLSAGHQVIVITHLAQVAAFADAHLVVAKQERDGRAHTSVHAVVGADRVSEVARMLSGSGSEASLSHARELLASVVDQAV